MAEEIYIKSTRMLPNGKVVLQCVWRGTDGIMILDGDQFITFSQNQGKDVLPKNDALKNLGQDAQFRAAQFSQDLIHKAFQATQNTYFPDIYAYLILSHPCGRHDFVGLDRDLSHRVFYQYESISDPFPRQTLEIQTQGYTRLPLKIEKTNQIDSLRLLKVDKGYQKFTVTLSNHGHIFPQKLYLKENDPLLVFHDDGLGRKGFLIPKKAGDLFRTIPSNVEILPEIFLGVDLKKLPS